MSDQPDSPTTLPSGTTGTRYSGSTRGQDSSGQSSTESRIDTNDKFRIGGPGRLPNWPVNIRPPVRTDKMMASAAQEIGISHLTQNGLNFERAFLCTCTTEGSAVSDDDTTLMIEIPFDDNYEKLVSVLGDLIQALHGLGFRGKTHMIDPRATGGPLSFPPSFTKDQEERWDGILTNVINTLARGGVDWSQVMAAGRGYWEEIALTTVVVKANILPEHTSIVVRELLQILEEHDLKLEFMSTKSMWGLFGDTEGATDNQMILSNIGWPFNPTSHGMGLSLSHQFESVPSTLGGYLKISHNGVDHVMGLGCYHGFRKNKKGNTDPQMDSTGGKNLSWPCQSPSNHDIKILAESLHDDISTPIPDDEDPSIRAENIAICQESMQKLQCVQNFNPYIGDVVAVSGWRNVPIGPALKDPLIFVDWSCILISEHHCPHPLNNISRMKRALRQNFPEGLPHWRTDKSKVDTVGKIPEEEIPVFKRGRTTGLTGGILGGLVPAAHRLKGLPAHLHHRGYIVYSSPRRQTFCLPGDSGSWCINGDGDVVGQLVGGHRRDGTGIVIPFHVVLEDIERLLELQPGSVRLA